jgi:hypothetical protein
VTSQDKPTPKLTYRSRITNGTALLSGDADGRSVWARRFKDLISEHTSDLGGVEATSAAERSIIRRCAALTVECERMEAKFAANGEASESDLDLYSRVSGNLRRLHDALGYQRRAKPVISLKDYLEAKANEPTPADEGE